LVGGHYQRFLPERQDTIIVERSVTGGAFAKGPVFCGPSARRDASNGTAANPGAARVRAKPPRPQRISA